MSLNRTDIEKIANLARLATTEEDIPSYASDLSSILTLVEDLNQANTDDIEPMAHPMDAFQRLRVDQVTEQNQRDKFQTIAPSIEEGLYLVPKVIE
jgi:aspartyl-tRNA(Asn)/glutamyl-tRNA(Gln) amidotransferase subunit C